LRRFPSRLCHPRHERASTTAISNAASSSLLRVAFIENTGGCALEARVLGRCIWAFQIARTRGVNYVIKKNISAVTIGSECESSKFSRLAKNEVYGSFNVNLPVRT